MSYKVHQNPQWNNWLIVSILICFIISCQSGVEQLDTAKITDIPFSSDSNAQVPNLFVSPQNELYLSYISGNHQQGYTLNYSILNNQNKWEPAQTIAQGQKWFVNWADFPSLVVRKDSSMAAHWLAMRDKGTFDYDIYISQKHDTAQTWSEPLIPHRDSISAEHGFVSMIELANGNILAVWLDGRNTRVEGSVGGHGKGGPMSLRSAEFDTLGQLYREYEIDNRVCDCCQTDLALLPNGSAIAVYRDRSEKEVRDISYVIYENGKWSAPKNLHPDNWQIQGCPVNGPAIATQGQKVVVAWYSMIEQQKTIQVTFSDDGGKSFGKAIKLPYPSPLGRVDVEFIAEDRALVSLIDLTEGKGQIKTVVVEDGGSIHDATVISEIKTSRASGFPIMAKMNQNIFLAWTVTGKPSTIKTVKIPIE